MKGVRGRCYLITFVIGATILFNESCGITLTRLPNSFDNETADFDLNYSDEYNETLLLKNVSYGVIGDDIIKSINSAIKDYLYALSNSSEFSIGTNDSFNSSDGKKNNANLLFLLKNATFGETEDDIIKSINSSIEDYLYALSNSSEFSFRTNDSFDSSDEKKNNASLLSLLKNATFESKNLSIEDYLYALPNPSEFSISSSDWKKNNLSIFPSLDNSTYDETGRELIGLINSTTDPYFLTLSNSSNFLKITNDSLSSDREELNIEDNLKGNYSYISIENNATYDGNEDNVTFSDVNNDNENLNYVYVINDTGIISYVPSNNISYSDLQYNHVNITAWGPKIKINNKHHHLPWENSRNNSSIWYAVYLKTITEKPLQCPPTVYFDRPPVSQVEWLNGTNFGSVTTFNNDTLNVLLFAENGQPCISMNLNMMFMVFYNKIDYDPDGLRNAMIFPRLPKDTDNVTIEGNCGYESQSFIRIGWDGYLLTWYFTEQPAEHVWYVSRLDLLIYTKQEWFHKYGICGDYFEFSAPLKALTSPLDEAYRASDDTKIELLYPDELYDSIKNNIKVFVYIKKNFFLRPFFNL